MKFVQSLLAAWILSESVVVAKEQAAHNNLRLLGREQRHKRHHHHNKHSEATLHEPWESRIVGGSAAPDGRYPYFVLGDGCGASLVAPDVVLTAAHCLGAFDDEVRVGSIRESSGGVVVRTNKNQELRHPQYDDDTVEYDFMLVKLREEVDFTTVPINFNTNNPATNSNAVLTTIGFGALRESGGFPSRLQEVDVNYVNPARCDDLYGGNGEIKPDIMLCAGVPGGGKDSCQGDSGGPIIDANGVQVGVVSFGDGCARAESPGVYARTSGITSWLQTNICSMATTKPGFCGGNNGGDGGNGGDDGGNDGGDNGGGGGGDGGDTKIKVVISHDDYPEETAWTLKDSNNRVILRQGEDEVLDWSAVVTREASVPAGSYRFAMTDREDDGICCDFGRGKVQIYVDNQLIKTIAGDFGASTSFSFTTGAGGGGGGDNGGDDGGDNGGADVKYMVTARYDDFPRETSFKIKDRSSGATIVNRPTGATNVPNDVFTEELDLAPGRSYKLIVKDTGRDGLDGGFVEVYAMSNGQKTVFERIEGDFGRKKNRQFTVPSDLGRTSRTTATRKAKHQRRSELESAVTDTISKCRDTTDVFEVSESVGEQDCVWLRENLLEFEFMCDLVRTAAACPHTCGLCKLFA